MKSAIILLITVTVVLTQEHYDAYYDTLDIAAMLSDGKVFKELLGCFMDKGPCNETHQRMKGKLLCSS